MLQLQSSDSNASKTQEEKIAVDEENEDDRRKSGGQVSQENIGKVKKKRRVK